MAHETSNGTIQGIASTVLGLLCAGGVTGGLLLYGQVQSMAAQLQAQREALQIYERRLRNCERIYNPAAYAADGPSVRAAP